MNNSIKIFAIAGSLRKNASNINILKAVALMAPGYVDFIIYEGLGDLPHFNDSDDAPDPVIDFRRRLSEADGVFICTPEYAFGVPGVLKNCLDWTVGSGEFVNKPVAFISAATGGDKAYASLLLTLTALSSKITEGATLLISFVRSKLNDKGEIADPATYEAVRSVLDVLINTIKESKV